MQAVVLAGGMGRQIKSELGNAPKPMAVVNSKPFLEFVLIYLKKNGVEDIIISCGNMRNVIESYFEDGREWNLSIRYTDETFLRGTAGSVKLAESMISGNDHFLVVNGDTFHDIPIYDLMEFHINHDAYVTMALKESRNSEKYGVVELNPEGQITRFLLRGNKNTPSMVNTGIYVFNREVLKLIRPDEAISLEMDIFPQLANLGRMFGYSCNGDFLDIEEKENYEFIKMKLKELVKDS